MCTFVTALFKRPKHWTWLIVGFYVSSAFAQERTEKPKLCIKNGWKILPSWAVEEAPFNAKLFFEIQDSENREQLYLEALIAFDLGRAGWLIEGVDQRPDFAEKVEESEARRERVLTFIEKCTDGYTRPFSLGPHDLEAGAKIVSDFRRGFALLEQAEKRNQCFFHQDIDVSVSSLTYSFDLVFDALRIRSQPELRSGVEAESVDIALRLVRDLQRLGSPMAQHNFAGWESSILNGWVWHALEFSELDGSQLTELVAVLKGHYLEQQEFDPCIAAERYQFLMWQRLFRELENGEYEKTIDQRSKSLGLDVTLPAPALLVRELTELGDYQVNSVALDEYVAEAAKKDPQMRAAAEALDKARGAVSESDPVEQFLLNDRIDGAGLAPILFHVLPSMTADDYSNEVKLLVARYKQIEAACQKPYPQSTRELKVLCTQWTTDDAWRATKLLRWFQPQQYQYKARFQGELRRNAVLCVAAVLKWTRDNEGRLPEDLEKVFSAIGLDHVPVDPYSGTPLKIAIIGGKTAIYSVGPDGDDDRAARPIDVFHGGPALIAEIPPDGDVVYQLGKEPGSGVLQ